MPPLSLAADVIANGIMPDSTPWREVEDGYTPPLSQGDIAANRKSEILARLAEIDRESIRPLRAIADGNAVQADQDKLAALDTEAAGLREELAGLG